MIFADFETYSEAGFYFDPERNKWRGLVPKKKGGLPLVGAAVYAEHGSTDILCFRYRLSRTGPVHFWMPGAPNPTDVFDALARGEEFHAHNVMFERLIWLHVAQRRYGWPALPVDLLRCTASKARRFSLPGALDNACEAWRTPIQKDLAGKAVMLKVSCPKNPTKKDASTRYTLEQHPDLYVTTYNYCGDDVAAEQSLSDSIPDLDDVELDIWRVDQAINWRGVGIDREAVNALRSTAQFEAVKANAELAQITGGIVQGYTEVAALTRWLQAQGVGITSLDAESVDAWLPRLEAMPAERRTLEIRQEMARSSVAKLDAMFHTVSSDGRVKGLFIYCGADRTGRWAGFGVQPQNMPRSGPKPWGLADVDFTIEALKRGDVEAVRSKYGSVMHAISGCLRGMFVPAPGYDFICSDYTSIEAVVLAGLAGEQWRLDAIARGECLYTITASDLTGTSVADYQAYKAEHGEDHPDRAKLGKVGELASGFGGSVGAWKAFGADTYFESDDEIKRAVYRWRHANPMISKLWYGLEDAARGAITRPGAWFPYREISYYYDGRILYCRLPSGRFLHYHNARIQDVYKWGEWRDEIVYEGWNTNAKFGGYGWVTLDTWGGKLAENVTQAVARDIFAAGMVRCEKAGYKIVLHTHDEPCAEVPEGWGSIDEFEGLMCAPLPWCAEWPIKAAGGWRGKRYRKD